MTEGYSICPEWLKECYKKANFFTCQNCHNKFVPIELQIHRIKRGNRGGLYVPNNCVCLCIKCHKKIHEREFRR